MKKLAIASALLATFAFAGTAQAYQAEVGGTVKLIDPDNGSNSAGYAVDGTYYFNPVQVKNSPLNEAAFLNRASNINGSINYDDYDNSDLTTFGAGVEYFVPNTDFYVGANVANSTLKAKGADDEDLTTYGVEAGYLPAPGLLVAVGIKGWDMTMMMALTQHSVLNM